MVYASHYILDNHDWTKLLDVVGSPFMSLLVLSIVQLIWSTQCQVHVYQIGSTGMGFNYCMNESRVHSLPHLRNCFTKTPLVPVCMCMSRAVLHTLLKLCLKKLVL